MIEGQTSAEALALDPLGQSSYELHSRHPTRSELWIWTWLKNNGYAVDTFTDADFHVGSFDPADYAGRILTSHPEYWSGEMRDRV